MLNKNDILFAGMIETFSQSGSSLVLNYYVCFDKDK